MDGDAERICKSCHGCQVVVDFRAPEPMQRTEPPSPYENFTHDFTCETFISYVKLGISHVNLGFHM